MPESACINVLGMDPSLTNWGLAFAKYNVKTKQLKVNNIQLQKTKKSAHKGYRVNTDDLARAHLLAGLAFKAAERADIIFVEVPTGSQSARAMVSYGVCIGILASLQTNQFPFISVSSADIKLHATGDPHASKQAMIDWATKKYPKLLWPTLKRGRKTSIVASKCEHMADAIGAIEAGLLTPEFQQLMALKR